MKERFVKEGVMNRFRSVLCTAIFSSLLLIACATDVWAVICIEKCVPVKGEFTINFDQAADRNSIDAPTSFLTATRLKNEYAPLGVKFIGPTGEGGKDGGAILNQGATFGVNAHSSPNFLAFNSGAFLSDGGQPIGPETIEFLPSIGTVLEVSIWAAGGDSTDTFTLSAYDGLSNLPVATSSVTTQDWSLLDVNWPSGIRRVVLTQESGDGTFVYDDLHVSYETCRVPEPGTHLLICAGLLALIAVSRAFRSRQRG
jgi:hypothetical protein